MKKLRPMLLSREEMAFDFHSASFDLERDRELLIWIFSQFLYGEVSGIQVGHWLYRAPTLDAANFLALQAVEELQHVDRFYDMLTFLEAAPIPAHRAVRFLSSGMMGEDWAEHVCIEMALGEGYVLSVLYALIQTVPHEQIRSLLLSTTCQEESHVAFGEQETIKILSEQPQLRNKLLGLCMGSLFVVDILARTIENRRTKGHPVLDQFPAFLRQLRKSAELRLERMGLVEGQISDVGFLRRSCKIGVASVAHVLHSLWPLRRSRLTKNYLDDPRLRSS